MSTPSVFVGSSSEGLPFARAVRQQLESDAEITLWNEGFFALGQTFIETLVNSLATFDFALLVLTGDDLVKSRSDERLGPRDNVLFELGLFMGRLGRARTIALVDSGAAIKLPSDLMGVTMAGYTWPREDGNYQRAVGAACDRIRQVIQALGVSDAKKALALSSIEKKQQEQDTELKQQSEQIRMLRFALRGIVTEDECEKLKGLDHEGAFECCYADAMLWELNRLRSMGLVNNRPGVGLRDIKARFAGSPDAFDLKVFFFITDDGREYLRLREQTEMDCME